MILLYKFKIHKNCFSTWQLSIFQVYFKCKWIGSAQLPPVSSKAKLVERSVTLGTGVLFITPPQHRHKHRTALGCVSNGLRECVRSSATEHARPSTVRDVCGDARLQFSDFLLAKLFSLPHRQSGENAPRWMRLFDGRYAARCVWLMFSWIYVARAFGSRSNYEA